MEMTRQLQIKGMSCAHCVQTVTKALESVPGVTKAQVTLETGIAAVQLSSDQVSAEQLRRAVQEVGYEVEG
jgi:copper ion binding protein